MLGNKKDEIKKSKKGKENIIGKIIYGFLLFMPLLAITSTILVNTFNKENRQPTQEVNITYLYEDGTDLNNLELHKLYFADEFNYSSIQMNQGSYTKFYVYSWNSIWYSLNGLESEYIGSNYNSSNGNYVYFYIEDGVDAYMGFTNENVYQELIIDDFDIEGFVFSIEEELEDGIKAFEFSNISLTDFNVIDSVEVIEHETTLNDVFYKAVELVENSPLFNWSKNSELYTVIHNTCNILDLNNTFIPMLLTYWVIISIIYVIYDIALIALHVVHRKIHELQDSI